MDCRAFGYKAWGFLGLGLGFFWHLTPRTFVKSFYYLSTDYFRRLKSSSPENVIFLTCIRKSVRCIKKSVEKYSPEENVDFSVWKTEIQNIFICLLKYCYFKMPLWYTARDLVLPLYVSIHLYKHGFLYGHIFHGALKVLHSGKQCITFVTTHSRSCNPSFRAQEIGSYCERFLHLQH